MINISETIRQLTSSSEAMRALVQSISPEQAQWKPNPETWSMKEVMEHVYNEERFDFRLRLNEMLNDPPEPWGFRHLDYISTATCRQALESFLLEREASMAWLKALGSVDWDFRTQATFGPSHETMIFSAGDILVSWVAHDLLHIRQINELHFAWNEKQAAPYSVQYAGGW